MFIAKYHLKYRYRGSMYVPAVHAQFCTPTALVHRYLLSASFVNEYGVLEDRCAVIFGHVFMMSTTKDRQTTENPRCVCVCVYVYVVYKLLREGCDCCVGRKTFDMLQFVLPFQKYHWPTVEGDKQVVSPSCVTGISLPSTVA